LQVFLKVAEVEEVEAATIISLRGLRRHRQDSCTMLFQGSRYTRRATTLSGGACHVTQKSKSLHLLYVQALLLLYAVLALRFLYILHQKFGTWSSD
jgi:hypothetical protein